MKQAEKWARRFHDVYERLAPAYGYETRRETRQFDPESPNGQLMMAVVTQVLTDFCMEELMPSDKSSE